MSIKFGSPAGQNPEPAAVSQETQLMEVEPYNIKADRQQMTAQLTDSKEVDDIVSTIEVYNLETIVGFGGTVADEISKSSDVILNSMNMSQINDSGEMLNALAKIMDKFDIEEIKEDPGFFSKLFSNMRKQLDKILQKYHTMGEEVDKIYVQLKKYESEIKESNRKLEDLFQSNLQYYHELVKYILAGEQGCKEIDAYIAQRRSDMESTGDTSIQFELTTLEQAKMMLEQRTQDLRMAENVAMQSIPMIKTMEFANMNLVRKINSAFIITLPVFKQALAQAILLKRQRIQAEAMSALDEKTNEMLLRNAQNTAEQSKMTAQLASSSSVRIETLETTWKTIVQGIQDTRQIQEDARKKRQEDTQRLNVIKGEFEQMMRSQGQPTGNQ
ncbi:toxic anion resistance protein [Solibaculum mannosilyticum]|uniref:Toxic anion resistance protein n=1 Tax=Solibaculum mannosilyticum TaxID=2780922 RepID=A0A7I8D6V5_9FIRM|nr:toxic anion resistance protein [Solibaculum mannosilyticum]BCI60953.1 toxic anion resistance protein [Solibaculum mannosilyticum]CZT55462.1 TelA-like protein [Eubacteriaceae bacterium CHKCI005]